MKIFDPDGSKGLYKPKNKPSGGGRGAPPAVKTAATGEIRVKRGDGVVRTFPDEASAQRFEALVKGAGGSSSRVQ
jgi:hypothetical protein